MDSIFDAKILMLDDHGVVREAFQRLLNGFGFTGVETDSGQNAKKMLKKKKYDLLIQDLQRPTPNGSALYCYMKQDKDLVNVPIVLLTVSVPSYMDKRGFTIIKKHKFELTHEVVFHNACPVGWNDARIETPSFYIEGYVAKDSSSEEIFEKVTRILKFRKDCPDLCKEHERRNNYLWPHVHSRYRGAG